jgi:hypothetical protein
VVSSSSVNFRIVTAICRAAALIAFFSSIIFTLRLILSTQAGGALGYLPSYGPYLVSAEWAVGGLSGKAETIHKDGWRSFV